MRGLQCNLVWAAALCLLSATLQGQEAWQVDHEAGAKAAKAAHFAEAERLLLRSAEEARKAGAASPLLARSVLDLGEVYRTEGKYAPAQTCYDEALQIYSRQFGADSIQSAEVLNDQAELFKTLNDYGQAEPLLLKALAIRQQKLPEPDLATAQTQNDLGELYTATSAYDKAASLLQAALETRTHLLGADHEQVAQTLEALAGCGKTRFEALAQAHKWSPKDGQATHRNGYFPSGRPSRVLRGNASDHSSSQKWSACDPGTRIAGHRGGPSRG